MIFLFIGNSMTNKETRLGCVLRRVYASIQRISGVPGRTASRPKRLRRRSTAASSRA